MQVLPPISAAEVAAHTAEQMREMVQRRVKAAALSGTMAAPRRYQPARDGYWDGFAFTIDPQSCSNVALPPPSPRWYGQPAFSRTTPGSTSPCLINAAHHSIITASQPHRDCISSACTGKSRQPRPCSAAWAATQRCSRNGLPGIITVRPGRSDCGNLEIVAIQTCRVWRRITTNHAGSPGLAAHRLAS